MASNTEADTDAPLIDLNEADVKKMIARGKKRGYLTYDELNEALPQDQMSSEQIERQYFAILITFSAFHTVWLSILKNSLFPDSSRAPLVTKNCIKYNMTENQ